MVLKYAYLGYESIFGNKLTTEQLDSIFSRVDFNRKGYITYNGSLLSDLEFLMATISKKNLITRERLKIVFQIFDPVLKNINFTKIKDIFTLTNSEMNSMQLKEAIIIGKISQNILN